VFTGTGEYRDYSPSGLTARTLLNWQKHGYPEAGRRRKRPSKFDPYARYVLSRWEQGCANGLQLYEEIKQQGYTGTEHQVYQSLVPLRRQVRVIQKATVPHVGAPLETKGKLRSPEGLLNWPNL
jgi:hypothetical protein